MKKNINKYLGFLFMFTVVFTACEQDDSINLTEPDAALRLESPASSNVVLNFGLPDNPAFTVTWTDDVTGSSSYDVQLAIDADFNSPVSVGTSNSNSFSLTTTELNSILNTFNVDSFNNIPVYMRVTANNVMSNVISFSVTAFPTNGVELTSPTADDSYILSLSTADETAITINWNDASNSTTTHNIQLAVAGTEFANLVSLGSVTDETSFEASHGDLNAVALGLGLAADTGGNVDLRVVSTTTNSSDAVLERISESVTISITPYTISFPFLYLVGDATTPGWSNDNNNTPLFRDQAVPNNYVYTGYFNVGAFKLLETPGQWQPQWGTNDGSTLAVNLGDGSDPGVFSVATAGYYTYSFTTVGEGGTFSVASFDASSAPTYDKIGLIGQAIGGWGDGDEIDLTQDANDPHVWYALNVNFTNGEEFLIRPNDDWGNGLWRYTGSDKLYGQSNFDTGGDNFPFTGETGSYDVWFNDLDGSYVFIAN